jgi:hypothetical protein
MNIYLNKGLLGISTIAIVVALVLVKLLLYYMGWEFLSANPLYTGAISGAIFIMGFLLAGVFSDYKETEKYPAELRSSLESIWEDAKALKAAHPGFDAEAVRQALLETLTELFAGLSYEKHQTGLHSTFDALEKLLPAFVEMEKLGMPANHVVRLKSERSAVKKILLRIQQIQHTQFIPSVYFLAESIMVAIIGILLFLKSDGAPEFFVLFAFISYLLLFVARLLPVLERPLRHDHHTFDDVSLFLLYELEEKLRKG